MAAPEAPFEADIDWAAGFRAALDRFTEPILSAELAAVWGDVLDYLRPLGPYPYLAALLRVSHRVWSGSAPAITAPALARELDMEAEIPDEVRANIRALLERASPAP